MFWELTLGGRFDDVINGMMPVLVRLNCKKKPNINLSTRNDATAEYNISMFRSNLNDSFIYKCAFMTAQMKSTHSTELFYFYFVSLQIKRYV